MKRIFVLLTVFVLLVAGTVSVLADPIGVGGTFTESSSSQLAAHPGKGIPQGKPFEAQVETLLLSPIGVGGT